MQTLKEISAAKPSKLKRSSVNCVKRRIFYQVYLKEGRGTKVTSRGHLSDWKWPPASGWARTRALGPDAANRGRTPAPPPPTHAVEIVAALWRHLSDEVMDIDGPPSAAGGTGEAVKEAGLGALPAGIAARPASGPTDR